MLSATVILKEMFSLGFSLCFMCILGNSLKKKHCFQLKAFLCLPITTSLWWASGLYLERWYEGKSLLFSSSWLFTPSGYGRCNSWLTSHDRVGYVYTAGSSVLVGWEILSALASIYLILLTTAKAPSRASSVGYPSFLGHTVQSGSIIRSAVSVSLLVSVLTR